MELEDLMHDENAAPFTAPVKTAGKGAAKAPKNPLGAANGQTQKDGRRVEEIYQKKSQLEHILLRPDTYVGSIEKQTQEVWVQEGTGVVFKKVTYTPALYKIFDEIIVNAIDNKVRDKTMATLKVDINIETGTVSVMNDGAGIPVEMHSEEKVYVPELIFGHLLTSSNYNDAEKKVTGGRNGFGAKLANVFSKEFVVETCDGHRQKRYRQVFNDNMSIINKPVIKACKPTDNWTQISFTPDLARFNMTELEEDICSLMRKRVYDAAGVLGKGVKVFLNGTRVPIKDFSSYVDLYLKDKPDAVKIHEKINDRWEVCISASEGQFNQVSFVNGICTLRGGTHVNMISDQVASKLLEMINKKNKSAGVKPFQIKNQLMVFVNALIENPAFDSQTKETLTSRPASFGSKAELSDDFIKKVFKSNITESVLSFAAFKQSKELKKNDGAKRSRLTGIPKLDDANDAGTKNSQECTLILTEGDSAKALAISGLSVVGRDKYGVFPLRGKLLNVRDATHQQIMNNAEINNVKQILGLQHGKVYTDTKSLRYGHLMIMTDQDHDGSHIKGLLINFLHHFFPSLLKVPGFLVEFITPIVKAVKGKQSIPFYTLPEYDAWKESLGGTTKGWAVKYYKGLGTSTAAEAKEYFADLEFHRKGFAWECDGDGDLIEMAFSKKAADKRKTWLRAFTEGTFLDHSVSEVKYSDFINHELILFSRADLQRSIPALLDGFKPGQRKILFAAFKRKLRTDLKVAQLAGYVAEHSAYHHGEASLMTTIVGLAQSFCGSNNINVLVPSGQFGTRIMGGKDHASPRYIFTRLAPLTRVLFPECDDQLLHFLDDDGQKIEPDYYLPILPMVLVNGADGIGTGWSTSIPNYNPRDIVDNLKRLLSGEQPIAMHPWYKDFAGTISPVPEKVKKGEQPTVGGPTSYHITGVVEQLSDTALKISELPVRKWTQDYKEFLEGLVKPEKKEEKPTVEDYKEYHTDTTVHFEVTMTEAAMNDALRDGLHKKFKLTTTVSTSNMHLFNKDGVICKYDTPTQILEEFFHVRLDGYTRRRAALIRTCESEMCRLDNKMRFILGVVKGDIKVNNRKKREIEGDLMQQGFDEMTKTKAGLPGAAAAAPVDEDAAEDAGEMADVAQSAGGKGYDYLLSMPIFSLTLEKVQALCAERDGKQEALDELRGTTAHEMWTGDLDSFLVTYEEVQEEERVGNVKAAKQQRDGLKKQAKGNGKKAVKKKKGGSDSEDFSDDEFEVVKAKKKPAAAAKAPAAKKAAPAAKAAPQASVASFFAAACSIHDDAAPVPKAKAAPKAKAVAAAAVVVDSDSDDEPMSLMQRLAAKKAPGAVAAVAAAPKAAAAAKPKAAPKAAAKPKAAPKAKAAVVVLSDSDASDGDEAPVPVAKPRAARAVTKKMVVADSESDAESDDYASESDAGSDDEAMAMAITPEAKKKPAPAKKPAAVAAKKMAVVDDSDDDEAVVMTTPLAVKKTVARAVVDDDDSADDEFAFDEATPSPKMKKAAAKKVEKRPLAKAPKAAGKPKAVQAVVDDDLSEGPTPNAKKTKRAVELPSPVAASATDRPARAARGATKAYVVDDEDASEDASEEEEEDFSGEESD